MASDEIEQPHVRRSPRPDLVTVARAYSVSEADLAATTLESAGVKVFSHSRQTVALAWRWSYGLGGVQLCVPASQADLAAEILADFDASPPSGTTFWRALVALAVFLWVGVPPPPSGFYAVRSRPPLMSHSTQGKA